jgi:hypothetical protein
MSTFWKIFISVVVTIAVVGGGTFYLMEKQIDSVRSDNQSKMDDLNKQIAGLKSTTSTTATPATTTTPATTDATAGWKTYTNSTYGYSFKYPANDEITSPPTSNAATVNGADGGHWIFAVDIPDEANGLSLSDYVDQLIAAKIKIGSNDAGIKLSSTKTNITVGGKNAIEFSIKNYGDYGNAGATLYDNGNTINIKGDTATTQNNADFTLFLSTFQFTK